VPLPTPDRGGGSSPLELGKGEEGSNVHNPRFYKKRMLGGEVLQIRRGEGNLPYFPKVPKRGGVSERLGRPFGY